MTLHTRTPAGLDGVVAAATALSRVDGDRGELIIAGARVGDLAGRVPFEQLTARLWSLASGRNTGEREIHDMLGVARARSFERLPAILSAAEGLPVTAGFRAGVAALGPVAGLPDEAVLVGAMPVIAAALVRRSRGEAPVAPHPALGHAADTLRMLRGRPATEVEARALDAYLVTASDHGMNASTFTARVVASTQADLFMAVTAAYCALTGPLHGGAPGPVLDMLDAIGTRANIGPWVDAALARKERLMGFGHRIYRVRDPRADVLRGAVATLSRTERDLGLAAEVEAYARESLRKAKPDRPLDTNVEFYTAILLDALAIPREAFTLIFAVARVAGWTAHALEQQRTGRLLRPDSVYVGEMPA
ncbi:MAG: citrate synthase/methylcitrate synthase [Mesorhizobium sp.]